MIQPQTVLWAFLFGAFTLSAVACDRGAAPTLNDELPPLRPHCERRPAQPRKVPDDHALLWIDLSEHDPTERLVVLVDDEEVYRCSQAVSDELKR